MTMISKRDKLSERWTLVLSFVLETKEDKRQRYKGAREQLTIHIQEASKKDWRRTYSLEMPLTSCTPKTKAKAKSWSGECTDDDARHAVAKTWA